MLAAITEALAGIQSLTVAECERAFNCQLSADSDNPGQYWSTAPDLRIEILDVRIGQRGGIVVARLDEQAQESLAIEIQSLGKPEDIDIVSPPMGPAPSPSWSRKWSVAHTAAGAKIWYGMEELEGRERMVSISRKFKLD